MKVRLSLLIVVSLGLSAGLVLAQEADTSALSNFRQEGIASWYGEDYDGKPTASGEIFNSSLMTAAHPSLAFGTILTVTNTQNDHSVVVRVNDRGPFTVARILDVSRAAAEKLDMIVTGTAPVIIKTIQSDSPPAEDAEVVISLYAEPAQVEAVFETPVAAETDNNQQSSSPTLIPNLASITRPPANFLPFKPDSPDGRQFRLQVGSYKVIRYAAESFEKLNKAGLKVAYERYEDFYRVVLPFVPGEDLDDLAVILGNLGFREVLIREER